MSKERPLQPESLAPDAVLERYNSHPIALLQTYEYFTQTGEFAEHAKADFLLKVEQGYTPAAPGFSYPKLVIDQLVDWREDITEMLATTTSLDMKDEANRLIRENLTTRLAEVGIMLLAKLQSETDPTDPIYPVVSWQLQENMREVYGAPSKEDFRDVLGARMASLQGVLEADNLPWEVAEAAGFIRDNLPVYTNNAKIYEPGTDTIDWYARQLKERCVDSIVIVKQALQDGILNLDENGKLTSENIVAATNLVLRTQGYEGWKSVATTNTNIDTSQADQIIYIPAKRTMDVEEFEQVIIAHEVDQHVGRRVNGDTTGVAILGGLGCTDYLQWEEGNGKASEALISGKVKLTDSAFGFFLTGGLIMGLDKDDSNGRNFGETFDLVWRLKLLDAFAKNGNIDDMQARIRKAKDGAYDHVRRLFRGTDGKMPRVFYPKDAVNYYLGQVEVWRKWDKDMVQHDETQRRQEHQLERSAKINPLRSDHRRVAAKALDKLNTAEPL